MRKDFNETFTLLKKIGLLSKSSTPSIPESMPGIDDETPCGINIFRQFIDNVDFENLSMNRTFLSKSEISNSSFVSSDLSESYLSNNDFIDVDFSKAEIPHSQFRNSVFENVNFNNSNLMNTDFSESQFDNCTFDGTEMSGAIISSELRKSLILTAEQQEQVCWDIAEKNDEKTLESKDTLKYEVKSPQSLNEKLVFEFWDLGYEETAICVSNDVTVRYSILKNNNARLIYKHEFDNNSEFDEFFRNFYIKGLKKELLLTNLSVKEFLINNYPCGLKLGDKLILKEGFVQVINEREYDFSQMRNMEFIVLPGDKDIPQLIWLEFNEKSKCNEYIPIHEKALMNFTVLKK